MDRVARARRRGAAGWATAGRAVAHGAAALHRRAAHRHTRNPLLGTATNFFTLVLAIRLGTNLYWAFRLSASYPYVDAGQIATVHFLFLSAWLVWVGSLSSCRLRSALPRPSFVGLLPGGNAFLSRFARRVTLRRPLNLAVAVILLAVTAAFLIMANGGQPAIALRAALTLSVSWAAIVLLDRWLERFPPAGFEAQTLELMAVVFLVSLNPDLGFVHERTSVSIALRYYAFRHT